MPPPPPPPPRREASDRDATITSDSSKRRRRLARGGGSDGGGGEVVRPWASLDEDLVELIGCLVLAGDLLDYVRFRAVCSHWAKSTLRPRGRGLVDPRFHPRRWMMLPDGHGLYPGHPNLGGYVRFFSLSTGTFVRVHLPLFDDHVVLESVDGLLLLLRHRDRHDTTVRLLHPFTGDIAEFPPLSSLLPQMERYRYMSEDSKLSELRLYLGGICAAVTVGAAAGAITLMIAFDTRRRVAHAMAGDQRWTLSPCKLPLLLSAPVSFQGKLAPNMFFDEKYVHIWQIEPPTLNAEGSRLLFMQQARITVECPLVAIMDIVHLVECGSEQTLNGSRSVKHRLALVYRLADLISGRIIPLTNIGEHALFLGDRSLCVSSNKVFPSILGNSITCNYRLPIHDDSQVGICDQRLIEHYHLGSGTWSLAIPNDNPPASPYMLIHHIFTCCYRDHWNKALMFHGEIIPKWSVKPNMWIGVIPSFDHFSF
ncbi:unnamed protein product [Urochloa decumbens]|uniref:KIB1-4 beta-propeller domain-containing protein n=1 Tax=Urochloa decumbens TaxID=240449 RepID=A0ABC8YS23_9POAL